MEKLIVGALLLALLGGFAWFLVDYFRRLRKPPRYVGRAATAADDAAASDDDKGVPPPRGRRVHAVYGADGLVVTYDLDDYASCGERLHLQLLSGAYALVAPDALVRWDLADGLTVILVNDLFGQESNVHPDVADRWPASRDALYERALSQATATVLASDLQAFELRADDGRLLANFVSTPSSYAAAFALSTVATSAAGPHIFAIPNWSNAMLRTVDATLDADGVRWFADAARAPYATAERPGSPDVFHHADGRFARVIFDPDTGAVTAPPAFVSHLAAR